MSRKFEDLILMKSKATTFEKISRKYEKVIWLKSKPITLQKEQKVRRFNLVEK